MESLCSGLKLFFLMPKTGVQALQNSFRHFEDKSKLVFCAQGKKFEPCNFSQRKLIRRVALNCLETALVCLLLVFVQPTSCCILARCRLLCLSELQLLLEFSKLTAQKKGRQENFVCQFHHIKDCFRPHNLKISNYFV